MRAIADIGGARIAVNVDVGFGDATEPPAEWLDYPGPARHAGAAAARLRPGDGGCREFQAMVYLAWRTAG